MVYNLGFVIFLTNFSKTIGGGGMVLTAKSQNLGCWLDFFIVLSFETWIFYVASIYVTEYGNW